MQLRIPIAMPRNTNQIEQPKTQSQVGVDESKLWDAASAMPGLMDPAEYKHGTVTVAGNLGGDLARET